MKKILIWTWLLTKRLYKKPSFIAILLLIPLMVAGYSLTTQDESGMMTIAICCEDPNDPYSSELQRELSESSEIIRFIPNVAVNEGRQMVYDGAVDATWIIPSDISEQIMDYVSGSYTGSGFVSVIVREQTVPLLLSNEKLSASLFVRCARTCFLNYFRQNAPEFDSYSDDEILSYFDDVSFDADFFDFSYVNSSGNNKDELNYLLLPVRGMLSVLILVSGLATAMYYISDEEEGLFSQVALKRKPYVELAYQMISIFNVTVFVLIALAFSGSFTNLFLELLSAILYVICCSAFCRLLRLLCRNSRIIAMILPILLVLALIACPIFISISSLNVFGIILPPTYYINAVYNSSYFIYMIIYCVILIAIYELLIRFTPLK